MLTERHAVGTTEQLRNEQAKRPSSLRRAERRRGCRGSRSGMGTGSVVRGEARETSTGTSTVDASAPPERAAAGVLGGALCGADDGAD